MKTSHICIMTMLVAIAGCGGGGGGDFGTVGQGVSLALADFAIIDLQTGTVAGANGVDTTDARYRDRYLLLRRVAAGSVAGGGALGHPWTLADEPQRTMSAESCFVGVFEVTRAQWQYLGGTADWDSFPAAIVGSGSALPAVGSSQTAVAAKADGLSGLVPGIVSLPTSSEWEYWCRAGSTGLFHWGDATTTAITARYAVTSDSTPGLSAPQIVGGREANSFGLYDMHGNAWELTQDDVIRGGSWRDGLPMARAANLQALDPSLGHPLVGFRLVYRP